MARRLLRPRRLTLLLMVVFWENTHQRSGCGRQTVPPQKSRENAGQGAKTALSSAVMSGALKPEFPPLLPVGLHPLTMVALGGLCVGRFPLSSTRLEIMSGLDAAIQKLVDAKMAGDLWIDGSFLTEKIDPEDVDLTLRLTCEFVEGCSVAQQEMIAWFNQAEVLKQPYHCHSFAWVDFPHGHPLYWEGEWDRAFWIRQWGFSQRNVRKGIAVVELPGGVA